MENKISWTSRDYQKKERNPNWYWVFWAFMILFIFITIFFYEDSIFAGLLFMVGILITLANMKKAEIFECVITDTFFLNKTLEEKTLFENIEYYNIDKQNHVIVFKEKKNNFFPKTLPFEPTQNMKKVDEFLSKRLTKNEEYVYPLSLVLLNNVLGI